MNILDKIAAVLALPDVKRGYLPDAPNNCIALFEYAAVPPDHHFGGTDYFHGLQVRCRDKDSNSAYQMAVSAQEKLNRYQDADISILQATPILDIGRDDKQRQEYTVNFTIRRL